MPITSTHFMVSKVKYECTIEEFCKERDLEPSRANLHILLEFNSVDKTYIVKGVIRDVILMDKVSSIRFVTLLLPRAHVQGVKQLVCLSVVVVVVGTKIARSRILHCKK